MFAIPLILVLAVLGLGSLAAVVFGVVYAIVNKRPGMAIASLLAPVALLFGVGVVGLLVALFSHSSVVVQSDEPIHVNWAVGPSIPSMPPIPPMPAVRDFPAEFRFTGVSGPGWVKLAVVLLVCFGVVQLFRKRASCSGERRSGWGKAFVLLVIVAMLLTSRLSQENVRSVVDRGRAEAPREMAEQNRLALESARLQAMEVQRKAEEVREQAAIHAIENSSMMQLFEQLNRPRIKLDPDGQVASMSIGDGANRIEMRADNNGGATLTTPISDKTPESLARSLSRLERIVEQVSAVADQVSDVGTLIGKAMIALNDSIDSRSHAKVGGPATTRDVIEAALPTGTEEPAAHAVLVEADAPIQQTIEINFDQHKLSQFGLSFDKIRETLGHDGFWRGASVRFISNELRIVVTGDFEVDYESRLSGTLVGTVGTLRRPIHMGDVATITGLPDTVLHVATSSEASKSSRPAWVDEAPKNIGNVRRQVIVAGDFVTHEECSREMDRQLYLATLQRLAELTGESDRNLLNDVVAPRMLDQSGPAKLDLAYVAALYLNRMGIGINFIRSEIAQKEYVETVERSFGPMKVLYTQVEFSPSVDAELRQRWDELRRQDRFAMVGVGAGSVLGLIGLALGLLKVDTWTRGYYSKRLFLGVPAAIIGILGLLSLAAGK